MAQLTAIYGFPESSNKNRTWELIRSVVPSHDVPWMCFGDFNDVLYPCDKRRGDHVGLNHLQFIHSTLQAYHLQDLVALVSTLLSAIRGRSLEPLKNGLIMH